MDTLVHVSISTNNELNACLATFIFVQYRNERNNVEFAQTTLYYSIRLFYQPQEALSHRKLVSTNKPVAFRSVHTGIEPPFSLKIYYAITACMTRGFTSRKY